MTIVRKEKKPGKEEPIVEREVTFQEVIRFDEFPVLNESEEILVLVDEASPIAYPIPAPEPSASDAERGDHRIYWHADPQQGKDRDARDLRQLHRQVPASGR
jgi:hypothetical protein